jgi:hypothetical protein
MEGRLCRAVARVGASRGGGWRRVKPSGEGLRIMEWGKGAMRQASAVALISVVLQIGDEGSAAVIPSRADIGMVRPTPSVEIFDAGNQPQHMGACLKTLPFGGRERRAPVERVIKIVGMGKERLGYFISQAWNDRDSALLQQNPAMRNSHLEGRTSSGIPNYYFRGEGVPFAVRPDSDCSNPWPIRLYSGVPEFHRSPHQYSGYENKQASKEANKETFVVIHKSDSAGKKSEYTTNSFYAFGVFLYMLFPTVCLLLNGRRGLQCIMGWCALTFVLFVAGTLQ